MKDLIVANVEKAISKTMTVFARRRKSAWNLEEMRTVMDMEFAYKRDQLPAVNAIKASVMMVLINVAVVLIHSSVTQMHVCNGASGYLSKMIMNAVNCQT